RWTAAAMWGSSASAGKPVKALLMSSSASGGSRKKSPLRRTALSAPLSTSRSTTTSLPPGTLYSPCMARSDSVLVGEFPLHAVVRRYEAQRLVKPMRVGPCFVSRQLNHTAALRTALFDGPFEKCAACARATFAGGYPDALDLAAPQAAARQARDEAQLQTTDDLPGAFGHGQILIGIVSDRLECRDVT